MRKFSFDPQQFVTHFLVAQGHCDAAGHADANETAVFGRQLEAAIAGSYDIEYYKTLARTLIPVRNVGNGVALLSYKQYDVAGVADFINDYANDFPSVEIKGAEFFTHFQGIGASYGYSIQDWRNAQQAGLPLDAMKARAAREAVERQIEAMACSGNALRNMTGLANGANVPILTQGTTAGLSGTTTSGKTWLAGGGSSVATPQEIFADMSAVCKSIYDLTLTLGTPDTVVFPTKIYSMLVSTLFSPTFSSDTVMDVLLKANKWIKTVECWSRLDTMGADGKGRIVVYKKDPRVLELLISQDFETFPPVVQGMQFTINCHARIGNVQIRYPKFMAYFDGCGGTIS